jgi:hypothetical protein
VASVLDQFLSWCADKGIEADQLAAYRVCAEQILREAAWAPVEAQHVEAARDALEAANTKVVVLAQLRNVGDALRRYQKEAASSAAPSRRRSAAPSAKTATAQEPGAAPVVLTDRITPLPLGRAYALLAVLAVIGIALYFGLRTPADSQQAAPRDPSTKHSSAKEETDEEEEEETEHPEAAAVRRAYAEFHQAMRAGDAARLKELTAAEKLEELKAEDAEEKLQLAKELYPEQAKVLSVEVTGDKAVLTARAKMGEQSAKGRISFIKQGSQWRVSNAAWNISITAEPEEEEERKPDNASPAPEEDSDEDEDESAEPPSTEGNGPGEATLELDGVAEKYILKVGFFYDTKLKDPTRAMLHFEHPAPKNSNARRILLTLDATQRGRHYANGQDIHDSMFNDKPVKVGEVSNGARAAILQWQADGGQVFPPKIGTTCEINVVSPYTGEADSELVITIDECPIHSAGIDRTLGSVKLKVRGPIER